MIKSRFMAFRRLRKLYRQEQRWARATVQHMGFMGYTDNEISFELGDIKIR
jgi:hypothetical protein